MTTGIPFPSTSEDDASSLFSIDIDDESPPPSPPSSSSTPRNGSLIGTHCPPSPTAEIGEPILSQSSVDQFWAEIEEQHMIDEARWPMTTPDPSTCLKKRTREQEEDTVSLGDEPLDWGDGMDDVCDLLANNPYGGSPPRDLYVTCDGTE